MASSLNISEIQLFNSLKKKLGEKEAEDLVGYIKTSIQEEVKDQLPEIATKDFVKAEIATSKNDIIKWMFGFWITIILLILANWFFK